MRDCGEDVRELLHDGHPTACVGDAAFAYVNAFKAHVNVGFFRGAEIADPERLLEGTGKFMRHVKLRPERDVDATALLKLIETAYTDMKGRLTAEYSCRHSRRRITIRWTRAAGAPLATSGCGAGGFDSRRCVKPTVGFFLWTQLICQ